MLFLSGLMLIGILVSVDFSSNALPVSCSYHRLIVFGVCLIRLPGLCSVLPFGDFMIAYVYTYSKMVFFTKYVYTFCAFCMCTHIERYDIMFYTY